MALLHEDCVGVSGFFRKKVEMGHGVLACKAKVEKKEVKEGLGHPSME